MKTWAWVTRFIVVGWCARVSTRLTPRSPWQLEVGGDSQIICTIGSAASWWKHKISLRACWILLLMCIQIMLRYIKRPYDVDACMRKPWVFATHRHTQSLETASAQCCVTFFFLSLEVFEIWNDKGSRFI